MDVYLFPLVNVTLFPKTTKPLNVFEPKYLEMVRHAVAHRVPLALAYVEEPSVLNAEATVGQRPASVREIAGYGIPQILEERANGTMLIFVTGEGKCRLGPVKATQTPYLVCEAEPITEDLSVDLSLHPKIQALNRILARWITTHIPDESQRELFLKNLSGPEEIVGAFGAYLVRDYDLQQMVLEFNSLNEKIEFLYRLAESNETT